MEHNIQEVKEQFYQKVFFFFLYFEQFKFHSFIQDSALINFKNVEM